MPQYDYGHWPVVVDGIEKPFYPNKDGTRVSFEFAANSYYVDNGPLANMLRDSASDAQALVASIIRNAGPHIGPTWELIEKYKTLLEEGGLGDELYKWQIVEKLKGHPDPHAENFVDEIRLLNYKNLVFRLVKRVSRGLSVERTEQYRVAVQRLLDESQSLQNRISSFIEEVAAVHEELSELGSHHDERTASAFLTSRYPDRYTFYKNSYYTKFCNRLGVVHQTTPRCYVHYLELLKDFVGDYVLSDVDLLNSVDACLAPGCYSDRYRLLLGQDILYRCLDLNAKNAVGADTNQELESMKTFPLNTIFYGPPGTGKTYSTVEAAVRIAAATEFETHQERKAEFDRLRDDGQIEFITFHQNYSYEDFIAGIRPDVDAGTLSFQSRKGVFYEIAKRARDNFESAKEGTSGYRSFSEVFSELIEPLERGETVPIKMASGVEFRITEVSQFSIRFEKPIGDSVHTLSISTLEDIVSGRREALHGLASYYRPLAKLLNEKRRVAGRVERPKNYVLIIDEVNRGNISRIFGELITLIEDDKRLGKENELRVTLPNGERDFAVPPNLYLLGTMNTADKSIALIDIALRRRFEFVGYYPKPELIDKEDSKALLEHLNSAIFEKKKSADFLIGHAYFMKPEKLEKTLRNRILPLLMEYFSSNTQIVTELFHGSGWAVEYAGFDWNIKKD